MNTKLKQIAENQNKSIENINAKLKQIAEVQGKEIGSIKREIRENIKLNFNNDYTQFTSLPNQYLIEKS